MTLQAEVTLILNFAGENNEVHPRICRLDAKNYTLSQVSAAGFLDNYLKTSAQTLVASDFIATACSNGHQWYKPVFTDGSCQLTILP